MARRSRFSRRFCLMSLAVIGSGGCAAVPEAGMVPTQAGSIPAGPIPAGFGTLRPADLSVQLTEGPLQVEVTPLTEDILRLMVPDASDRLRAVANLGGQLNGATPVLVTFYTENQGVRFEQSDLVIEASGRVLRAARVVGATQGWGTGLLRQQEPASAVYLFPELDLDREFTLRYRTVRSEQWAAVLPRIQAERGRIRGRAGGQSSSPNFLIFR